MRRGGEEEGPGSLGVVVLVVWCDGEGALFFLVRELFCERGGREVSVLVLYERRSEGGGGGPLTRIALRHLTELVWWWLQALMDLVGGCCARVASALCPIPFFLPLLFHFIYRVCLFFRQVVYPTQRQRWVSD
jgi:hypothetical protein